MSSAIVANNQKNLKELRTTTLPPEVLEGQRQIIMAIED
jgi:hypothetical protein